MTAEVLVIKSFLVYRKALILILLATLLFAWYCETKLLGDPEAKESRVASEISYALKGGFLFMNLFILGLAALLYLSISEPD